MSKKIDRTGETIRQRCGINATVIAYRNQRDMDVRFESGETRVGVTYANFVRGDIALKPRKEQSDRLRNERLHQKKVMNCGLECEIISYDGADNIAVKFDDGTVIADREYKDFEKGTIKHPDALKIKNRAKRVGTRQQMHNGLFAVVKVYRNTKDIDVEFEIDGAITCHKSWHDFQRGKIAHPTIKFIPYVEDRLGEIKTMNSGLQVEVIRYASSWDMDVKFLIDGAIVRGTNYKLFKQGSITHPTMASIFTSSMQEFAVGYYLNQLGFRKVKKGEWKDVGFGRMELDFYNEVHHVAIEVDGSIHNKEGGFEGDIRKNSKCKELGIRLYRLRDQALQDLNDDNSVNYVLRRANRINGSLVIDCSSELMSILNENCIEVPCGFIDFRRDFDNIMDVYTQTVINPRSVRHVGERAYFKSARQHATLTVFRNVMSVDIVFDDGCERHNVTYDNFKKGNVRHPKVSSSEIAKDLVKNGKNRIASLGEKRKSEKAQGLIGKEFQLSHGHTAKVIQYDGHNKITILFEDGVVRSGVSHRALKEGYVKYPNE